MGPSWGSDTGKETGVPGHYPLLLLLVLFKEKQREAGYHPFCSLSEGAREGYCPAY